MTTYQQAENVAVYFKSEGSNFGTLPGGPFTDAQGKQYMAFAACDMRNAASLTWCPANDTIWTVFVVMFVIAPAAYFLVR